MPRRRPAHEPRRGARARGLRREPTPSTRSRRRSSPRPPAAGSRCGRVQDFEASAAVGVSARVDGRTVQVGGPGMLDREGSSRRSRHRRLGRGRIDRAARLVDGEVAGAIALADEVRPESREAVDALHSLGVQVVMITGDAEPVARTVAAAARHRPRVRRRAPRGQGREGAGTAGRGPVGRDGRRRRERRPGARAGRRRHRDRRRHGCRDRVGRRHPRVNRPAFGALGHRAVASELPQDAQNLWWAAGYNLISVPLAAGVLAPIGFVLPMSVGAILMSLSTIIVAANAQLLRRLDLRPEASARAVLERSR